MFTYLLHLSYSFFNFRWATPMGKNKNTSLTHAQIWDDSALVQSWDDAVEEYELYHSIHAKGENVEDVLKEAEESGAATDAHTADKQNDNAAADQDVQPKDEDVSMIIDEQTSASVHASTISASIPESATDAAPAPSQPEASKPATQMPHPIMATVQDESLKNLMMSWYYAGYYTGLHEGQQQSNRK
ncbi:Survival motor neuron [Penicillium paradoxum]|uniref:Survival motor neuron n=1 Tax=Penicillium paradoxum TaxID=176176 RepID=UPI0025487F7E|nr:Survival motor neuron [Penicillium paradoxum]KAJ5787352.1 Survival motor neuron [Penicillium paradoxum]